MVFHILLYNAPTLGRRVIGLTRNKGQKFRRRWRLLSLLRAVVSLRAIVYAPSLVGALRYDAISSAIQQQITRNDVV
jgi:hypothetical protein